ncbi:MAG TPA: NADH dehydrogenase (quinone) subunit D [Gaiellaceae bacterium]|nr:NADH dehydrogenase (quinone) subunit D [Gaiellaceae bacterium]
MAISNKSVGARLQPGSDPVSIYSGTRIPSPIPTMLVVPEKLRENDDILQVNFGPNHPSTHGVLRLVVDLDGENVVGLSAVIGYLHTGFEKNMEAKTWWKAITYPARIDYLAFQANEYAFVAAIEKLLEIEVPPKATWMRTLLLELNRIHSHLIWLGTGALEIGAISMLWYCFNARDLVLDLFELVGGTRMHTRYFQAGGLVEDIPRGFFTECKKFCDDFPKAIDQYEALLTNQKIWLERTRGLGLLSAEDAIALGQSGPVLRASGVDWDIRRAEPYLAYPELDFDVPVYHGGDVYDRYRIRVDEMRESVRIIEQCLDGMPGGAWIAGDRKVVLPPREELHTSMESLIHHFKIVTEGYSVPEGEVYVTVESPRGEFGCYVVSDGGPKPWRVKFRAPSFVALEATATCMSDALVADMIAIVGSLDTVMGEVDR